MKVVLGNEVNFLVSVAATKVWLGFWKPQCVAKVGKKSLYDKWAI
jgi:hypothetical protein